MGPSMAEWREKGYVPDSDEEDDSQAPSVKVPLFHTPQAIDTNHNASKARSENDKAVNRSDNSLDSAGQSDEEDIVSGSLSVRETDGVVEIDVNKQGHGYQEGLAEVQSQAQSAGHEYDENRIEATDTTALHNFEFAEGDLSRASSPLSEAPSSLSDFPTFSNLQTEPNTGPLLGDPRKSSALSDLAVIDGPTSIRQQNEHEGIFNPRRTFRHRNAIQLHPYVIEKEKFNQTWRARGLKPVHILQEEAAKAQAQQEDSQNFEVSQNADSPASSPPLQLITTNVSPSPRQESLFDADADDLPDVHALLQGNPHSFASVGHKRRKTVPKFKKPPKLPPRKEDNLHVTLTNDSLDDESLMFDVPPSPPLPGSQTPSTFMHFVEPLFQNPPVAKTPSLPTPLTSSEPRQRQSRRIVVNDDSDETSPVPECDSRVSEDADPSSNDDSQHQLQRAQRRIKGVLPASWLKLDLKTHARQPQRERRHSANAPLDEDNNQKGVARPVDRSARKTSAQLASPREVFILSDDDDAESSDDLKVMRDPQGADSSPLGLDNWFSPIFWGEAMEDNSVEALLPPVKRSRMNTQRPRKRQTRIGDYGVRGKPTSAKAKIVPQVSGSLQLSVSRQIPKSKRKPRFHPPNLGILEATERQSDAQYCHPTFVKVARRTARLRRDKGRHSPTCKSIRLATREDTEDVNETVQAWREGTIAQSIIEGPPKMRKPLHPRSLNYATRSTHGGLARNQKQTRIITSMLNTRPRPGKTKNSSSALDNFASRHPPPGVDESSLMSLLPQVSHYGTGERRMRQLFSSLKRSAERRPALLESSQIEQENLHPRTAFDQKLPMSDRSASNHQSRKPILDRFLLDEDPLAAVQEVQIPKPWSAGSSLPKPGQPKRIRTRKRKPRRLETENLRLQGQNLPVVVDELPDPNVPNSIQPVIHTNRLQGLGPFGTRYTTTFDVKSLPARTSFALDTFVGSGDFAKSLSLQENCNLDSPRGFCLITCDTRVFRWGVWNESVSSELAEVFQRIEQGIQTVAQRNFKNNASVGAHAVTLQTAIISYLSSHVSFSDAIDRIAFLQRCQVLLNAFWNAHSSAAIILLGRDANDSTAAKRSASQIAMLGLVFANQLRQISEHGVVPFQLKHEIAELVEISAKQLSSQIGPGIDDFEDNLVKSRRAFENGRPLTIDRLTIEAFVITNHITRKADTRLLHVLEFMQASMLITSMENNIDVGSSERSWRKLFELLPFLELDEQGALDVGQRFRCPRGDWTLVKRLINPILESYLSDPHGQGSNFNAYCRSLFSRCLHLVNGWGWYHCDSIIGTFFDFFAKNGLAHLRNEQSHGSPPFLEDLSNNPPLDARPEDPCFHLLLKIIGSGVKHMRTLYNPKRIRDLVWRLMPNHGRSHPKEQAVRQEDLDALRNHHDLLCTLYWASPPSFRPSLNGIRTLVDLERSHREACHINIRAWFNLVKFQLSTDEPVEDLEPFTQWHSDVLQQMLRQHGLARTEAEDQVSAAQSVEGLRVSHELLESTIAQNQTQVEAVLDDALVCMELAIGAAKTQKAAAVFLSPALTGAFSLSHGSKAVASGIVIKALNVLLAYAKKSTTTKRQILPHSDNDDSQDYGDWSAFHDDNALEAEPITPTSSPLEQIMRPLRSLVSNCFGADMMPPEGLLTKLIDTWVAVGCVLVEDRVKTWEDYLGQFGNDTWHALRDTDQTRKYSAYFFSSLIEANVQAYRENRFAVLKYWLGSLVERESRLKFQHKFTSSLLNVNFDDPLLDNLPFWKGGCTARFSITAVEFSDRRLSLISSFLSNLRSSFETATLDSNSIAAQLKQEYKDLLKHLMTTMKQNYLELGQGSNIRGAYVTFVHCVVEFLQEHTSFICPVDRFFTDNTAFPLPVSDPNYVVGKLKNYGTRISDPKMQKELIVFLQSVSERAAVDHQQDHLVQQLQMAMSKPCKESAAGSTLCKFVVSAVLSACMQTVFDYPVGWVFAMPYLKAVEKVFRRIQLDLNTCDTSSVNSCMAIIMAFLGCARTAMHSLKAATSCFESASVMRTLAHCYRVVVALLPTLDYMLRVGPHKAQSPALELMAFFKNFAAYSHAIIAPLATIAPPVLDEPCVDHFFEDPQYDTMHGFAIHELRGTLTKNWLRVGDDYFVMRGSSRQQVKVDIGSFEEERDGLRLVLHDFGDCLSGMSGLGGWGEWLEVTKSVQNRLDFDELFF